MQYRRALVAAAAGVLVLTGTAYALAGDSQTAADLRTLCTQATAHPSPSTAQWARDCLGVLDFTPSASPGPQSPSPSTQSPWPSAVPSSPVPSPAGFPTAATTGVPAGTALSSTSTCKISASGVTITAKRFTCTVEITGANVTITRSELPYGITNWTEAGGHSFVLEDSTVGPASGCAHDNGSLAIAGTDFTAKRNLIRGFPDAFRVSERGAAITDRPIVIEGNYAKLCATSGDHSDGVQAFQTNAGAVIRHNTIDQRALCCTTSNVFWANDSLGSALVEDNLLMGGGYTIRLYWYGGPNHVVRNNRVVDKSWEYGPAVNDCDHIDWSGNNIVTIDSAYQVTGTVRSLPCS